MKGLKKVYFAIVMVGLCAMALHFTSVNTAAKETKMQNLENNKTYYVDLDGDGKKETIRYYEVFGTQRDFVRFYLFINGKQCIYEYDEETIFSPSVQIADLNSKTKGKEVVFAKRGDSDSNIQTIVYQYSNGNLKKYFSFKDQKELVRSELLCKQPGNGKVRIVTDTPYYNSHFGCYHMQINYKIVKGQLKKIAQKTYTTGTYYEENGKIKKTPIYYYATKKLSVKKSMKSKKTKFTIKKGQRFYVEKINISKKKVKYIYIKNKKR